MKRAWPLGLAMAFGLVARVWSLGSHSLLLDEASVAIGARDILRNHMPMWDAISNAPFVWLAAHLIGLRGLDSPFLIRLPAALFGTAAIPLVYWLARRLYNHPVAVASAVLVALHPFAVAFNRVLFADAFQLFFILGGCIAFDYFAGSHTGERKRLPLLLAIFLIWGVAFLMKYNAIVPGALWLLAGVITRRYSLRRALAAFVAMALGAAATLIPWLYDAPVWLLAFAGKGGSYSIIGAAYFFWAKLHLVLFGATELLLIAGILFSFLRVWGRKSIAQLTIFILLYFVTISILGRSFERYLLMVVPFGCMLVVGIIAIIPGADVPQRWLAVPTAGQRRPPSTREYLGWLGSLIIIVLLAIGYCQAYSNYFAYLHNDIDRAQLASDAERLEDGNHQGFWLLPESIGGYYLGFSQFYSRTVHPCLDSGLAGRNYFEWESMPYCEHAEGQGIFAIRKMARSAGLWHLFTEPLRFRDSAKAIAQAMRSCPQPPALDYLTTDFIRTRDILVMQCGMTDLQEEPILEDISNEGGPPYISRLPLDRFRVVRVYRPEGESSPVADTSITRVRAGAWLMIRK